MELQKSFELNCKIRYGINTTWVVAYALNDDLGHYLRHLYYLSTYKTKKLQKPIWGCHISLVRNEKILDSTNWKLYNERVVPVTVLRHIHDNSIYYWMDVDQPLFQELRLSLGLSPEPIYPFHLTIGNNLLEGKNNAV